MRKQNILRTVLFVVFFSVASASLTLAILCKDLERYYHNKAALRFSEEKLAKLKSLNKDYDILLSQVAADPNLVGRLGPATLGREPSKADTVYPKAHAEQLAAAKKALAAEQVKKVKEPEIPKWLERCNERGKRIGLFIASGILIIISFVCFNPVFKKDE